mgnify:CR=1 FL=1
MQPLSLTLKGFRGIRDGLGRDVLKLDFERLADGAELVAIAGHYKVLDDIPRELHGKPVQISLHDDELRIDALD